MKSVRKNITSKDMEMAAIMNRERMYTDYRRHALWESRPFLLCEQGMHKGARFFLEPHETSIGRGTHNVIVLDDPHASNTHAVITQTVEGYKIRDENSRNGLYLNGKKQYSSILESGDRVRIGMTLLKVVIP